MLTSQELDVAALRAATPNIGFYYAYVILLKIDIVPKPIRMIPLPQLSQIDQRRISKNCLMIPVNVPAIAKGNTEPIA